jgi:hypothetical protein
MALFQVRYLNLHLVFMRIVFKNSTKLFTTFIAFFLCLTFSNAQEKDDDFTIGGAVRFNMFSKSWVDSKKQPEVTIDTWRLNVDGSKGGIDLSFEYRFYPTYGTHFIHHGYFGYDLSDDLVE